MFKIIGFSVKTVIAGERHIRPEAARLSVGFVRGGIRRKRLTGARNRAILYLIKCFRTGFAEE